MKSFSRFPGEENFFLRRNSLEKFTRFKLVRCNFLLLPSTMPDMKVGKLLLAIENERSAIGEIQGKFHGREKANDHGSGKNVESKFPFLNFYISKQISPFGLSLFNKYYFIWEA